MESDKDWQEEFEEWYDNYFIINLTENENENKENYITT